MRHTRTLALRALLLGGLATSLLSGAGRAQTSLTTEANVLDGPIEDIAGWEDGTTQTSTRRTYLAMTRTLASIRITDRVRMFDEDRQYSSVLGAPERIIAIELDAENNRLYAVTEQGLYVEDVRDPRNPVLKAYLAVGFPQGTLPNHAEEWDEVDEPPLDLKLWPEDNRVVILTCGRLVVVQDQGDTLTYQSQIEDLLLAPRGWLGTNQDLAFNATRVNLFERLRLHRAEDGKVVALVTAVMSGYSAGGRPYPLMALLADLDEDGDYAYPTFDFNPLPGGQVRFLYYNPMPLPPSASPPVANEDYTTYSIDMFTDEAAEHFGLLACGKEQQVIKVRIDETLPTAYPESGMDMIENYILTGVGVPNNGFHVRNVLADRTRPHRFFAVHTEGLHVYDPTVNPDSNVRTENEPFGTKGLKRDLLHTTMPSIQALALQGPVITGKQKAPSLPQTVKQTIWTATKGKTDYVCKVVRVATDDDPLKLEDQYFGISSSDGAVAVDDEVYIPTFGGVVRYTIDDPAAASPEWRAVPESYQPSEVPEGSGNITNTEHIDVGQVDGAHRLFTSSALGNFMEFEIDSERNPMPARRWDPDPTMLPVTGSWTNYPNGSFYSNDVAFLDLDPTSTTDKKFLLTPLTNYFVTGQPTMVQHLLLAYRYEQVGNGFQWVHRATVEAPQLQGGPADVELSKAVVIAEVPAQGTTYAFVGHDQGFMVLDVTGLADAVPSMTLVQDVMASIDVGGGVFENFGIWGIARSENRIFVQILGPTATWRIYPWDETTGIVGTHVTEYDTASLFGSIQPGRSFRARYHETGPAPGEGHVYFACEPYLVQLKWPGSGAIPEDSLDFTGYWVSDYQFELQDCRIVNFPAFNDEPRVLVSKNSEAFAIVDPDL